jgi:integrase
MPRKLPPYVIRERSRHGRVVFYFRVGKGPRVRLPDLGTPEFEQAYQAARQAAAPPQPPQQRQETLAWLIARYERSSAYAALKPATRRQRDNIFKHVVKEAGSFPYAEIRQSDIMAARERRKDTPAQARNVLDAYRGLFRWAVEEGLLQSDPTEGVRNPGRVKGPGFVAWTNADVAKYRARWPAGTRQYVWLMVLLSTGLRRGDAVRVGWQHVQHRMIVLETEKKGVFAFVPVSRELARVLAIGPVGRETWIAGERGEALTKESFGNMFKAACLAAGVDRKKSAHGLRKLAATMDAERGLTVEQMKSVYGWTSDSMASHYTKTADKLRHAREAAKKRR